MKSALCFGVLSAAIAALCSIGASPGTSRAEFARDEKVVAESTLDEDLQAFRSGLEQFRQGKDGVLPALRDCAQRCASNGRPDVPDVLQFFTAIPVDARQQGWEL